MRSREGTQQCIRSWAWLAKAYARALWLLGNKHRPWSLHERDWDSIGPMQWLRLVSLEQGSEGSIAIVYQVDSCSWHYGERELSGRGPKLRLAEPHAALQQFRYLIPRTHNWAQPLLVSILLVGQGRECARGGGSPSRCAYFPVKQSRAAVLESKFTIPVLVTPPQDHWGKDEIYGH